MSGGTSVDLSAVWRCPRDAWVLRWESPASRATPLPQDDKGLRPRTECGEVRCAPEDPTSGVALDAESKIPTPSASLRAGFLAREARSGVPSASRVKLFGKVALPASCTGPSLGVVRFAGDSAASG